MKKLLVIIPLFILLSSFAYAGNFTITANNSVTLASILSFTAALNNNYFNPYSLQETANVSTAFGGKVSGTYGFVGVAGANGWAYINYSKNDTFAPLPVWQVKHGINTSNTSQINSVKNYTIPLSCWSFSTTNIQLRMYTKNGITSGASWGECNNGTTWVLVTENITCTSASVFSPLRGTGSDYFYDTNYSSGIFYELNGVNLFKNINQTAISSGPLTCDGTSGNSGVAGIIYEEGLWWYDGGNLTFTTATGSIVTNITNPVARVYDVIITSTGYVTETTTAKNVSTNLSALLDPYQLNLTFFDENTTQLLNGTLVSFSITGVGYSYNNTTLTGSAVIPTVPNNITLAIIYSATGYNQRSYYTNISAANTSIALFLRSTATSTPLLIQVQNQALTRVAGALVYQTIKNLSGTNYYTTEICQTDSNGQCIMSADISTATYRATTTYNFLVYYNNTLVGQSGDTVVATTASAACNSALPCLQLVVTIGSSALNTFFNIPRITYSFNNTSANEFTCTLVDAASIVDQICLRSYMVTGATSTQTNSSCVSSSNGSVSVFSNSSLGDRTDFVCSVVIDGQTYIVDTRSVNNQTSGGEGNLLFIILGGAGLFLTVILSYKGQGSLALIMGAVAINILFLVSSLPGLVKGFAIAITLLILLVVSRLRE